MGRSSTLWLNVRDGEGRCRTVLELEIPVRDTMGPRIPFSAAVLCPSSLWRQWSGSTDSKPLAASASSLLVSSQSELILRFAACIAINTCFVNRLSALPYSNHVTPLDATEMLAMHEDYARRERSVPES